MRLRSGDGTVHIVSRATLMGCTYFQAKLARWESGEIEVDADDASVRALLTLLRYGKKAIPALALPLRAMVTKDADYLGVPRELWAHLEVNPSIEITSKYLGVCKHCNKRALQRKWKCTGCESPVDERATQRLNCSDLCNFVAHDCGLCGVEYARCIEQCLVCHNLCCP
jgi:hypothetical protein